MRIGRVIELWRYPVKSMGGGRIDRARVDEKGLPGDRGWAIRDEAAGEIRGAKKFPVLLQCQARYLEEPSGASIPVAEITLPNGEVVRADSSEASAKLSALIGKKVTIWPRRPADDLDHYRRGLPDSPDMETELRQIFGRLEDEPLPDLMAFPPEILEFSSPLGTYFDAFPIHLLTTSSLAELSRLNPEAAFDRRRFRPNLLIELDEVKPGFAELDWCGREVTIGGATLKIEMPVVRCSMTTHPQGELPKDPTVLRTIVREAAQSVGVYASVVRAGEIAAGDSLTLRKPE